LHCGLAAYDPLADEFLNDARFVDNPEDDVWNRWAKVELVMFNGIWLLHTTRGHAAGFLASVVQEDMPGAEELARAAACYEQEVAVLHTATEYIPLEAAEEHCVTITRPEVRQALRRIVQEAKGHEVEAVGHVGRALAALPRWNLMAYRDLYEWISDPFELPPAAPPPVQYRLFAVGQ
jgi:hypothetical protein